MILPAAAGAPAAARAAQQRGSVLIPSFGRPELLGRCLRALAAQTTPALEAIVVGRTGDEPTAEVARAEGAKLLTVATPGHLPPLVLGTRAARAEIVCVLDDDCEPWPAWLGALLRHYADSNVGGVGGLVSQPATGERKVATEVCRISPAGRFDALGGQKIPATWGARDVDVLLGGNMSYRRELLDAYPWDARLNRGAATDYEVDLAAWVRRRGYRLVYDPDAIVTHDLAPRPELGRAWSARATEDYSHNLVYVSGKALGGARGVAALVSSFLVGSRASYGLATAIADTLAGRPPSWRDELRPALAGKVAGLASLRAYRRDGPLPIEDP